MKIYINVVRGDGWGRCCKKGAGLAKFIKGVCFGDLFRDYQLSKKGSHSRGWLYPGV